MSTKNMLQIITEVQEGLQAPYLSRDMKEKLSATLESLKGQTVTEVIRESMSVLDPKTWALDFIEKFPEMVSVFQEVLAVAPQQDEPVFTPATDNNVLCIPKGTTDVQLFEALEKIGIHVKIIISPEAEYQQVISAVKDWLRADKTKTRPGFFVADLGNYFGIDYNRLNIPTDTTFDEIFTELKHKGHTTDVLISSSADETDISEAIVEWDDQRHATGVSRINPMIIVLDLNARYNLGLITENLIPSENTYGPQNVQTELRLSVDQFLRLDNYIDVVSKDDSVNSINIYVNNVTGAMNIGFNQAGTFANEEGRRRRTGGGYRNRSEDRESRGRGRHFDRETRRSSND